MKKFFAFFVVAPLLFFLGYYLGTSYKEGLVLESSSYSHMPGWKKANLMNSLNAFKHSCKSFLRQPGDRDISTSIIELSINDFKPACRALLNAPIDNNEQAREYFKKWFLPYRFYKQGTPVKGLFTGYYLPSIAGSKEKTEVYDIPIYKTPKDLIRIHLGDFSKDLSGKTIIARIEKNKVLPYHAREAINHGAIQKQAKVIAYVKSRIDRLFLGIQGSGFIDLPDGKKIIVSYDAQNGKSYTALAGLLIKDGIFTRDQASMQRIKAYLDEHPDKLDHYLHQNESFVFYRVIHNDDIKGAQNVPLSPGYSLAVDKRFIPLGIPLWLSTTYPNAQSPDESKPLKRLMVAQDTGGAIRGPVRGDVYWGGGDKAAIIAGHMKNKGYYWLLLPNKQS